MKKFMLVSTIVLIFVISVSFLHAQRTVTGKVIDGETGNPIPNITVKVKDQNAKTKSDGSGHYKLKVPKDIKDITFEDLSGWSVQKVEILTPNKINILMTSQDMAYFDMSLEDLMDVKVTTASKKEEKISDAPAVIATITAQQIKDYGVQTLPELLRYIPGFTVEDTYWRGPVITSRGVAMTLYNDKILMLIDGVPAYEAVTLEYYLDVVPVTAIKRLEVIRGPGSTLYGTNAFSGVINVITKNGDTKDEYAYLKGGSFNTRSGGFVAGDKKGDISYMVSSTFTDNDGYNHALPSDEAGNENIQLNYENDIQNVMAKFKYKGLSLTTGYYFQNIAKFSMTTNVAYGGNQVPDAGMAEHTKYYANLSYDFFQQKDKMDAKLTLHYDYMDKEIGVGAFGTLNLANLLVGDNTYPSDLTTLSTKYEAPNYSLYKGQLFNTDFQMSYNLSEDISLIGGITHELRDVENVYTLLGERGGTEIPTHEGSVPYPPDQVNDFGGYVQVNGSLFEKLNYTAGIRLTYLGISEEAYLTPRAAIVYPILENLNAKLLYGQAFRGPGFQEQYFRVEGVAYGANAVGRSLKPERIDTYEAAFDWEISQKVAVRLNGFYLNTKDQILRRPLGSDSTILGHSSGLIYDNAGQQEIYGTELEVNGVVNKQLTFFANASYRDGKDKDSGDDLPYFIRYTANAGATVNLFEKIRITPTLQYVGPNEGSLGANTPPMYEDFQEVNIDGYALLNMVVNYQPAANLELAMELNNLTNNKYYYPERIRRQIPRLPGGSGLAAYFKIAYHFD